MLMLLPEILMIVGGIMGAVGLYAQKNYEGALWAAMFAGQALVSIHTYK